MMRIASLTLTGWVAHIIGMAKHSSRRTAETGRFLARSFVSGLAQAVSVTGVVRIDRPFPSSHGTASDALRGDWEKLGGDMRKAVDRAAPRGKK